MSTDEQILDLLRRQQADLDLIKRLVIPLAVRSASLKSQAKAAGVHPSTICRRRKRLAAAAAAAGIHGLPRLKPVAV